MNLVPGQHITVTVPWRASSHAHIPSGRLRMKLIATFYAYAQNGQGCPSPGTIG
jgi:hypothetical protein